MGEAILAAINSGLQLIKTIAQNFLAGFEALFVTENGITSFGTFAFIMLGIAITFACIRLAMRLIRGNTGV